MRPSTVCEHIPACFPLQCVNISLHTSLYSVYVFLHISLYSVYVSLHASLYRAFTCSYSLYIVYVFLLPYGVCVPASLCIMYVCSFFPVYTEQCVCVPSPLYSSIRFYTLTVCTCLYSIIHTTLD